MRSRLDSEEELVAAVSSREQQQHKRPIFKMAPAPPPVAPPQPDSPPAEGGRGGASKLAPRSIMEADGHLGWKVGSAPSGPCGGRARGGAGAGGGDLVLPAAVLQPAPRPSPSSGPPHPPTPLQGAWKGTWKKSRQGDGCAAAAAEELAEQQAQARARADWQHLRQEQQPEWPGNASAAVAERRLRHSDEGPGQGLLPRRASSSAPPGRQQQQQQPSAAAAAAIAALEEIKASGGGRYSSSSHQHHHSSGHHHLSSSGHHSSHLGGSGSLPPLPPRQQGPGGSPAGPPRSAGPQHSSGSGEPNLKVIRNGKKRTNAAPRAAAGFAPARLPWASPGSPDAAEAAAEEAPSSGPALLRHPGLLLQASGGHSLRSSLAASHQPRAFADGRTEGSCGAACKELRPLLYNGRSGALQSLLQAVGELQHSRWLPQQFASRTAVATVLGGLQPQRAPGYGACHRHAGLAMSLLLANLPSLEVIQQHVPVQLDGPRLAANVPKPPVPLFKADA
jgi:hypothetical protein